MFVKECHSFVIVKVYDKESWCIVEMFVLNDLSLIIVMKYEMLWWVEVVMRCDVMKNVSLTCHLIYYDEDVLRVCWNKSCDEVCENVLTYCS